MASIMATSNERLTNAFKYNCSIKTDDFVIPERHSDCHFNQEFTLLHPVNIIMLQYIFDEHAIVDIKPNITYTDPLNITLKNIQLYQHKFQSVIANADTINLIYKK